VKKQFTLPKTRVLDEAIKSFGFGERTIFYALAGVVVVSALLILWQLNAKLLVEIPARGGTISEGVIGTPRFINPLLAISDSDRDLTTLVYSGLLKPTPSGKLITDLASGHTISADGLVYTFKIRDDAEFHDGTPLLANDVAFTIGRALDSNLKSSRRANWEGVHVEVLDDRTIRFTLNTPYSPFLENTTMGILPKHLWENVTAEQFAFSTFNVEPVGSGPYKVSSIDRNGSGIPTSYTLRPYDKYALGAPHISRLIIRFYANEEELLKAFQKRDVDHINSISPSSALEFSLRDIRVEQSPLPRVFGLFFNQTEAQVFTNIEVRKALGVAIDRDQIVQSVLSGFGTPVLGPLPPGVLAKETTAPEASTTGTTTPPTRDSLATEILERNGWKMDESDGILKKKTKKENYSLSFSISTSNAPELKHVAEILKRDWEAIGASVELKFFDIGGLNQSVIRPRDYDTLLFGQIIGRDLDPFAFWHSSQRNDPGLNIALYTNIDVDDTLEKIRTTSNQKELDQLYIDFEDEIVSDIPAVFIYAPDFIYVVSPSLLGIEVGTVTTPAERFLNVHQWYLYTDKVWQFLEK